MPFPDPAEFATSRPGPYEESMGETIVRLLRALSRCSPDRESNACVAELAANPERWSAGHAFFDEVRDRLLDASDRGERLLVRQYSFEEDCCKAIYNAVNPEDPFDASSPFFVVPSAIYFAMDAGVSISDILAALHATKGAA